MFYYCQFDSSYRAKQLQTRVCVCVYKLLRQQSFPVGQPENANKQKHPPSPPLTLFYFLELME